MRGEYPYWGANCIVDHVDSWLFNEDLILLGEDGAPFFDRTKPVAFHVKGRVWVNNHAHVLRPLSRLNPDFLTHALNSVDYRTFVEGTTRDKLTQGRMNAIPIQCPSLEEQRRITEYVERGATQLDALARRVGAVITHLLEYRLALITAAVTGQIDVRNHPRKAS